jgi:tRNA(fMet)-specific endonuclease VapC
MQYMLDTNICSYVLRRRPASVKERFYEAGPDGLAVSSVVLAELLYGAARHPAGGAIRREVRDFVSRLQVLPWDEAAAEHYGDLRAGLERRGRPLGAMDLMIAAHARSRGATLVSNDVRHFERIDGLLVANWA